MDVGLTIATLAAWTREPCDGGIVLRGPEGARVRIRPRVTELRRPRALASEMLLALDAAEIAHLPITELVTPAGELAVIASARCTVDTRSREIAIAIVGDMPALQIDALATPGQAIALVTSLASELGLGLGERRRRWIRYTPPPGWFGVRRGTATHWLHPEYPRVPASATVFDARALATTESEALDRSLHVRMSDRFVEERALEPEDAPSRHALEGRLRTLYGTIRGVHTVRIVAAYADDRFSYLAHSEGPPQTVAIVRALLSSIRPVARSHSPSPFSVD